MFQFSVIGLWNLIRAFHEGEILLNPKAWKNVELIKGALVTVFMAALAFFPDIGITDVQVVAGSAAIATLGSIILTLVTTKKRGLPPRGKLYEKSVEKTSIDSATDNGGVQFQYQDERRNVPMQSDTEPNSLNDGGKGLSGK
jgi:hypothetical protein